MCTWWVVRRLWWISSDVRRLHCDLILTVTLCFSNLGFSTWQYSFALECLVWWSLYYFPSKLIFYWYTQILALSFLPGTSLGHLSEVKWKLLSCVQLFATQWTIQSMEFSRPEYWSGKPFSSTGDLPNPGIKPRSPALQADSLPAEPLGKPKNNALVAYPFSRRSSWPRNQTRFSCITGGFFTNWAMSIFLGG